MFRHALLFALLPAAALAEEAAPNLDPLADTRPGVVAERVFAQQLYLHALARKDALTMLAAARLAGGVTLRKVKGQPEATGKALPAQPDAAPAPPDAAAMLAAAQVLVEPEETLALLLEEGRAANALAPVGTARAIEATLSAGQSHSHTLPFDGAALAEVGLIEDGDARLALRVTDAAGTAICTPQTLGAPSLCSFSPRESGYFTVTVTNPGPGLSTYWLLSN